MPRFITCSLLVAWIICLVPTPETGAPRELHLKTRTFDPLTTPATKSNTRKAAKSGRQRLLVQFTRPLAVEEFALLIQKDALILGFVPDDAYVISTPEAFDWEPFPVRYRSPISAADKWSPLLDVPQALQDDNRPPAPAFYLVFFHEDVAPQDARDLALNQGLEVREHPNLAAQHLLVQGPEAVIRGLTEFDEVAYILPASEDLAKGWPVVACENGVVGNYPLSPLAAAASTGPGWAVNIRTPVTLTTTWGSLSPKLDPAITRSEIERAFAEWSRVVQVSFRAGSSPGAARNLHILFGTRSHGDGSPFTGTSGVIAHAFFPAPPNPEPIAGDIHFNDDMPFRIGADIDLFSVALHEIGHALGLPHIDSGNAIMYPYYRKYTALTSTDLANIRRLYLSSEAPSSAPPSAAFRLLVTPVAATTLDLTNLAGSVENGTLPIRVQWVNNRGGSGTILADSARQWSIRNVPLLAGANQFTLTATDAVNAQAIENLAVNRGTTSAPEPSAPEVRVIAPSNNERTSAATIRVNGTASSTQGLRRILWSTTTATGQADGLSQWTIPALPLQRGANSITIRAEAMNGAISSATLAITRDTATSDTSAPLLTITTPNIPSVSTSNATIIVSGAANDTGGVAAVTWQSSNGPTGTAAGTNSWRAEIPLNPGFNTIIIRARDTSGNTSWRSLSVTRR